MADGGYILILVVLILGGLIATLGDRIGTKVGKARLSLFNLRPRKTAVLVTVMTGVLISASTLGILLIASQGFRDMLLKFDNIRNSLDRTRKDLDQAKVEIQNRAAERKKIESELSEARARSRKVQKTLDQINASLKQAIDRQRNTEAQRLAVERQAQTLQSEIQTLEREQQDLMAQRDQVRAQIAERDQELASRDQQIQAKQQEIRSKDQEIQSRKAVLAQREQSLKTLQVERDRLMQESIRFNDEIATLQRERDFLQGENSAIRQKLPALPVNKILASAIIKEDIKDPRMAAEIVLQLLQNANNYAFREINPGITVNRNILNIAGNNAEFESLVRRMSSGGPYVLQMRSKANYFLGEDIPVSVGALLVPRRELFPTGAVLSSISIDPRQLSRNQIQDKISQLVPLSRLRVSQQGWLPDVGNEGIDTSQVPNLKDFVDRLQERSDLIDIQAITTQSIYPDTERIPLALRALQRGTVILDTRLP